MESSHDNGEKMLGRHGRGAILKERPILFSAPMVRAILADGKTQTRRIVKPLKTAPLPADDGWSFAMDAEGFGGLTKRYAGGVSCVPLPCARWLPGERLWVRETWCSGDLWLGEEKDPPQTIRYRADNSARAFRSPEPGDWFVPDMYAWSDPKTWKPSIFMSRWMSRITLEVVSVGVQRLQDISEYDAKAEGIEVPRCGCETCSHSSVICPADAGEYIQSYAHLWDSINGAGSWSSNPFVWRIKFKRLP